MVVMYCSVLTLTQVLTSFDSQFQCHLISSSIILPHLLLPLDPLEAALEQLVVVCHRLLDVGRARLVEGGVDGVRDGPLRPDEEGVVAETVSGA